MCSPVRFAGSELHSASARHCTNLHRPLMHFPRGRSVPIRYNEEVELLSEALQHTARVLASNPADREQKEGRQSCLPRSGPYEGVSSTTFPLMRYLHRDRIQQRAGRFFLSIKISPPVMALFPALSAFLTRM